MAARSGPPRLSKPALNRAVMVDTFNGTIRVRKWPKKRGPAKHPHTRYMNKWFKKAMQDIRFVDGRSMEFAINATKGTGLYPRDLLMAAATRGLFEIETPDGRILQQRSQGIWPVSFQGCRIERTTNKTIAASTFTLMDWQTAVLDTAGFWVPSAPTRITIPAGVNVVNISCRFNQGNAGINRANIGVNKNGAAGPINDNRAYNNSGGFGAVSGPLPVVAGDYFEAGLFFNATANILAGEYTSFCCEILDADYP